MSVIILVLALFLSYLLGSVPSSYILAKILRGIDIREYGSGNVGATNILRTLGKAPAAIALFFDILKGILAVTILSRLLYPFSIDIDYKSYQILMGLAVISGHIWTIFLRFKGGKGVATSIGVLFILCPKALGIAAIVWAVTVVLTKYVSLGSIIGSITLPIVTAFIGESLQLVLFTITLCIISTYKHKSNIIRLINGEESKITEKIKLS